MSKYTIRSGKFGDYFYDTVNEKDMGLHDVLIELNKTNNITISEIQFDEIMKRNTDDEGYIKRQHPSSSNYKGTKKLLGF